MFYSGSELPHKPPATWVLPASCYWNKAVKSRVCPFYPCRHWSPGFSQMLCVLQLSPPLCCGLFIPGHGSGLPCLTMMANSRPGLLQGTHAGRSPFPHHQGTWGDEQALPFFYPVATPVGTGTLVKPPSDGILPWLFPVSVSL